MRRGLDEVDEGSIRVDAMDLVAVMGFEEVKEVIAACAGAV